MRESARRLFGTDGIRGTANRHPLTPTVAVAVGAIAADTLAAGKKRKIVVGRDPRISSELLESALVAGILSAGVDAVRLGVLPTPAVGELARQTGAAGGVMISASHNPFPDNGIKLFGEDGAKVSEETEEEIARRLGDYPWTSSEGPVGALVGRLQPLPRARELYLELLRSRWPAGADLSRLRIVVDAANGAVSELVSPLFASLGGDPYIFSASPNGLNINLGCGSMHPERLAELVRLANADVGLALDGDGDRLLCCDHRGEVLDGDDLLAILTLDYQRREVLANRTVATTVMSNLGLDRMLQEAGVRVVRTPVGDRHVAAAMRAQGLNLGGEQSGHLLLLDQAASADGLRAGLEILRIILTTGRPLAELRQCLRKYPQQQISLAVREKKPLESMPNVESAIAEAERGLGTEGRILLRYSGTEPKIRLLIEGPDPEALEKWKERLLLALRHEEILLS
ncbi:phosphoglucosamine mutase [Methylacidimicrobium cyclopophantes]|uniref:Phosphoglucosamine mutase n=1 Tax=Methylacidimicrobium cyclopophantes TaxID=1041766 RepID=A0A5E6MB72_9BACT|nr:phosphoglucosamine mutase [Methylacidimicrobium cyclopophantes]VVM06665.1 phosphoglucosamine mutase [Methylacidimicrobium cyclopophantes]